MAEREVVSTATSIASSAETASKKGISVKRLFTKPGIHPFDDIEWESRTAALQNEKGQTIFEQRNGQKAEVRVFEAKPQDLKELPPPAPAWLAEAISTAFPQYLVASEKKAPSIVVSS